MSPKKFNLANIGGTFSSLHEGARTYIRTAFELAERVQIVVNDTDFAQATRAYPVPELSWRLRELENYIRDCGWQDRTAMLICPRDVREFGAWLEPELDSVIVSDRLQYQAIKFNELRVSCGLARFTIQVLPRLRDNDGSVLSSTNNFFAQVAAIQM